MPTLRRRVLLLVLLNSALAGCQTAERRPISSSEVAPDVVHYIGVAPVWIFIPFPSITDDVGGYPAQIALPPRRDYSTNRIELTVDGEVALPGIVSLRPGSTVLQAIGCAGGFTAFAHNERLHLTKSSGHTITLHLRSRRTPEGRYRQVWYDTKADGPYLSPKKSDKAFVSDYTLEPGDKIHVPRTM